MPSPIPLRCLITLLTAATLLVGVSFSTSAAASSAMHATESAFSYARAYGEIAFGAHFPTTRVGNRAQARATGEKEWGKIGVGYENARWLRRWLSPEPSFDDAVKQGPVGLNVYQYALWNPVRLIDVDGRIVIFADDASRRAVMTAVANSRDVAARYQRLQASAERVVVSSDAQLVGEGQVDWGGDEHGALVTLKLNAGFTGILQKLGLSTSEDTAAAHELRHAEIRVELMEKLRAAGSDQEKIKALYEEYAPQLDSEWSAYNAEDRYRIDVFMTPANRAAAQMKPGDASRMSTWSKKHPRAVREAKEFVKEFEKRSPEFGLSQEAP